MWRVPFFEDDSGFGHVLSPMFEKFNRRTVESAAVVVQMLVHTAAHGSQKELDALEQSVGIGYDRDGLLFDPDASAHINFPDCVYWDWMHNWCSSGGVGQYHVNRFALIITETIGMELADLDEFASKVVLPRSSPRLPKHFFKERVQSAKTAHIRAFASEILVAVIVLAMFVQLVLKPTGLLPDHVRCFEAMQAIFALFKRGLANEITMARDVNRMHHELYMRLYPECGKPKLHYCMHVIDCWERLGILLSCFGAESNHRYSADVFSFSYRKPCTTALVFDVRRLSQAIADGKTFQHTYLASNVKQWDEETLVDLGDCGIARITSSSTELVGTLGRYFKNDLLEWQIAGDRRLGLCQAFLHMQLANGDVWAAIVDELQHVGHGVWKTVHTNTVVNASLFVAAVPFVREGEFVRPLYVVV